MRRGSARYSKGFFHFGAEERDLVVSHPILERLLPSILTVSAILGDDCGVVNVGDYIIQLLAELLVE